MFSGSQKFSPIRACSYAHSILQGILLMDHLSLVGRDPFPRDHVTCQRGHKTVPNRAASNSWPEAVGKRQPTQREFVRDGAFLLYRSHAASRSARSRLKCSESLGHRKMQKNGERF